ncbi:MAG: DUF4373 domain-containing protein [Candidatus Azobacteroides sp.]|nr:DUF4373 domain-containing protein [Candidatus Azobacteroides sp.]
MARTNKTGIDYFPFDVDFFNDEKIEFTSARFGVKGEIIAIRLLCKIYRNGYYTDWSEDENTLLAKRAGEGITPSLVSEIVNELVRRGFFDKSLLDRFRILTSKGIQRRYFEAVKRYKRVDVIRDYLLVDVSKTDNVNIIEINGYINADNDNINPQKKREEKKRNVESVNTDSSPGGTPPDIFEPVDYKKFADWFNSETKGIFGSVRYPLGKKRRASVRARISEHGKESFVEVVKNAMESGFLRGQNARGWTATFDWLIKPSNYEKVLSGNYKNQENGTNQRNGGTGNRRPTSDELGSAVKIGIALAEAGKNRRRNP